MESSTTTPAKPNEFVTSQEIEQANPNPLPWQPSASYAAAVARGTVVPHVPPTNNGSTRAFSNAVNASFRKQGVVFDTLAENVPLEEYLDAVSLNIPAKQITHVSKINRMVQIYFANQTWANQLIEAGLEIREFYLDVRPLATAPTKIIISNVPPEISHQWLRGELSRFGRVIGPIKSLSAATSRPQYSHIRSFRRVALIEFADDGALDKLPAQMNFNLDGQPYSFYLSVDVKCFFCKRMGHVRKNCPDRNPTNYEEQGESSCFPKSTEEPQINNNNSASDRVPEPAQTADINVLLNEFNSPLDKTTEAVNEENVETVNQPIEVDNIPQTPIVNKEVKKKDRKRKSSPIASNNKVFTQEQQFFVPPTQPTSTKDTVHVVRDTDASTLSASSSCDLYWECDTPMEEDFDSKSQSSSQCSETGDSRELELFEHTTPLATEQLAAFLMEVKGSPYRLKFAKKYTTDIKALILQLQKLYLFLKLSPVQSKTFSWKRVQRVHKALSQEYTRFA